MALQYAGHRLSQSEETVISTMVTDVYQGLLARKKEETA